MDDIPLSTLGVALGILLLLSAFFSLAETAMMASNRHRLKHRAQRGERGAKLAQALLGQMDKLLGVILLGNTLVAAAAATITAVITKRLFGEGEWALALGTIAISFAILLFARWRYGWRGRRALRWILAGTLLLVLGYLGSKFVMEVLLRR